MSTTPTTPVENAAVVSPQDFEQLAEGLKSSTEAWDNHRQLLDQCILQLTQKREKKREKIHRYVMLSEELDLKLVHMGIRIRRLKDARTYSKAVQNNDPFPTRTSPPPQPRSAMFIALLQNGLSFDLPYTFPQLPVNTTPPAPILRRL
ncbi:hypothetical protein BD410DRAFT_840246 [Rickenella mellea]|uniref:Uncharacterized protein n=1 Tax=Rickenella mellea TaxID=50990 RepID=A0A4Y7Q2G6_9AGAM|nr:hypothetical protein BD410DRAFT_840246 [Rickenella mellea]